MRRREGGRTQFANSNLYMNVHHDIAIVSVRSIGCYGGFLSCAEDGYQSEKSIYIHSCTCILDVHVQVNE